MRYLYHKFKRFMSCFLRLIPGSSVSFGPVRRYCEVDENRQILSKASLSLRHLPDYADKPILSLFEKMRDGKVLEQSVSILNNGRYWGRSYGYIIDSNDCLIRGLSPELKAFGMTDSTSSSHDGLQQLNLPKVRHISGDVLVINTFFCSNFHHWLLDTLPKINLAKRAGFELQDFSAIIFDYKKVPYQEETLNLLGIDRETIIASTASTHISADRLVVPSYSEPGARVEHYNYTKEGMGFVRELFLGKSQLKVTPKRILVSRKKANARRYLREDELMKSLAPMGFEIMILEDYSLVDQAALFNRAECIVMPHGGGLANSVFCTPESSIIELFSPYYLPTFMMPLSERIGFHYRALVGQEILSQQDLAGNADIDMPVKKILGHVRDVLK